VQHHTSTTFVILAVIPCGPAELYHEIYDY
jgi:hypothetical protein